MKVYPFKITKPSNSSLIYQEDSTKEFYNKLHEHDEIQISYIENGDGILFVGNSLINYYSGDIFIIGGNVPHAFKSDKSSGNISRMKTLFFTKSSFGESFFKLNQFSEISSFFKEAKFSFQLKSNLEFVKAEFNLLAFEKEYNQFIIFLKILKLISEGKKNRLSHFLNQKHISDIDAKRMRDIFEFTIENSSKKISLAEIAGVANMTRNAFCKYFKKRTNKTYVEFLTELRIENSCKLLKENRDLSIAEIAMKSGFQNTSNFNRRFKNLKKITPLIYRRL